MKLNLGCGYDIRKGYDNIDKHNPQAIKHDLNKLLPYKDNSVSEILLYDILEHIDKPIKLLKECHRMITAKGIIKIRLPHFSCSNAYDPLHKTYWGTSYFKRFTEISGKGSYEQYNWFKIKKYKIHFFKGKMFWNNLIERLVNLNDSTMRIWEENLCWLYPANYIEVELEKK